MDYTVGPVSVSSHAPVRARKIQCSVRKVVGKAKVVDCMTNRCPVKRFCLLSCGPLKPLYHGLLGCFSSFLMTRLPSFCGWACLATSGLVLCLAVAPSRRGKKLVRSLSA
ncbi:hypothetical protein CHARACLAT_030563 [Characodon lateralis]|uniref:Uncharacterized protein n=1 Tax=Characodon lateralis TaxID=208331 RepID=A0ABU7EY91_9TELE|nr:hypothetical protein [Characodon lateralis]